MNLLKKSTFKNLFLYIGITLIYIAPYAIVDHLPIHRHVAPFILGESHIPFLPWTFIIYFSIYFQYLLVIWGASSRQLRRVFAPFVGIVIISLAAFIIWPIEFPRYLYPSTNSLMNFFRLIDGAGNCFPSLHVSVTIFLAACYSEISTSHFKKFLMWLWAFAIIVSVLTTKQHYLIDAFGGIGLATPFVIIFKKHFAVLPAGK